MRFVSFYSTRREQELLSLPEYPRFIVRFLSFYSTRREQELISIPEYPQFIVRFVSFTVHDGSRNC